MDAQEPMYPPTVNDPGAFDFSKGMAVRRGARMLLCSNIACHCKYYFTCLMMYKFKPTKAGKGPCSWMLCGLLRSPTVRTQVAPRISGCTQRRSCMRQAAGRRQGAGGDADDGCRGLFLLRPRGRARQLCIPGLWQCRHGGRTWPAHAAGAVEEAVRPTSCWLSSSNIAHAPMHCHGLRKRCCPEQWQCSCGIACSMFPYTLSCKHACLNGRNLAQWHLACGLQGGGEQAVASKLDKRVSPHRLMHIHLIQHKTTGCCCGRAVQAG